MNISVARQTSTRIPICAAYSQQDVFYYHRSLLSDGSQRASHCFFAVFSFRHRSKAGSHADRAQARTILQDFELALYLWPTGPEPDDLPANSTPIDGAEQASAGACPMLRQAARQVARPSQIMPSMLVRPLQVNQVHLGTSRSLYPGAGAPHAWPPRRAFARRRSAPGRLHPKKREACFTACRVYTGCVTR